MSAALGYYWRGECPLYGPAGVQSTGKSAGMNSNHFTPFRHAASLAAISKQFILAGISVVFLLSHPSAIAREISEIIINAVYGVLIGRWVSHIIKKVLKCSPSVANGYASRRIRGETHATGSIASANHAVPNAIDPIVIKSVLADSGPVGATAGTEAFLFKRVAGSLYFIPALASADIARRAPIEIIDPADNSQLSKNAPDFVVAELFSLRLAPAANAIAAHKGILAPADDAAALAANNPARVAIMGCLFNRRKIAESIARVYLVFHGMASCMGRYCIMPVTN